MAGILALDLIAVSAGKQYSLTQNNWWLATSIGLFALVGLLFPFLLGYKDLALANVIWGGLAAGLTVIIGILVFQEKLEWWQFAGVAMIIGGVMLIEWPGK